MFPISLFSSPQAPARPSWAYCRGTLSPRPGMRLTSEPRTPVLYFISGPWNIYQNATSWPRNQMIYFSQHQQHSAILEPFKVNKPSKIEHWELLPAAQGLKLVLEGEGKERKRSAVDKAHVLPLPELAERGPARPWPTREPRAGGRRGLRVRALAGLARRCHAVGRKGAPRLGPLLCAWACTELAWLGIRPPLLSYCLNKECWGRRSPGECWSEVLNRTPIQRLYPSLCGQTVGLRRPPVQGAREAADKRSCVVQAVGRREVYLFCILPRDYINLLWDLGAHSGIACLCPVMKAKWWLFFAKLGLIWTRTPGLFSSANLGDQSRARGQSWRDVSVLVRECGNF